MATPAQLASRKNGLKGGRPMASSTFQTQIQKTLLQEYLREHLDEMYDGQVGLAKGVHVMVARKWEKNKSGDLNRSGNWYQVTEVSEIIELLNSDGQGDDYHFLTTEKPSTPAFVALLDRAWGKPAQSITGADGADLFPTVREKEKANEALYAYLDK